MKSTIISVIICTYNRSNILVKAIESLLGQTLEKSLYEIIVVDNGSTDETEKVCDTFRKHDNFRYIYEPELGLSAARNTGIDNAKGDIVAFIDDDAEADSKWLSELASAFDNTQVDCVGGRAEGVFMDGRPEWLHDDLLSFIGVVDYGNERKYLSYPRYPLGVNISFKKNIFERVGKFGVYLGRKGNSLLSCEEIALCYEIEVKGGNIFYVPDALVNHSISPNRLKKTWFKERAYWQGISEIILEKEHLGSGHIIFKLIKILINLPLNAVRLLWGTVLQRKDIAFLSVCRIYICSGYIWGLFKTADNLLPE